MMGSLQATGSEGLGCRVYEEYLSTETTVESGTSQSESGTSFDLSNSGLLRVPDALIVSARHSAYRATSLINRALIGPYSRTMPGALWWP